MNILRNIYLAAVLLIAAGNCGCAGNRNHEKPNIVFIITDDQGYGDLSCHGHPVLETPNLDRLKDQSVSFTCYHASPTCSPTRAAIMSGRDPFYVGVTHTIFERERLALKVPTLPEMLKKAGYTTGLFGKWHLGDQEPYRPDKRGFDEVFQHGGGGIGQSYSGSCGDAPDNNYFDPIILHNEVFEKTKGFCTDVFVQEAISWIEKNKNKKPFFAFISTNAAHGPFICPEKYKKPFIEAGYDANQVGFHGMISNIDENIGLIMDILDEWSISDNTVIIFTTDNGSPVVSQSWNAGMKGAKGSLDEGGSRVPLFIRWPARIEPGIECNKLVRHVDLLPTIAEIVGVSPSESSQLHGQSLLSLCKDPDSDWEDRYLVFHRGRWQKDESPTHNKNKDFAVRSKKWRLVGPYQLYDMLNDPGQTKNVYSSHPYIVNDMMDHYNSWWDRAVPLMVNEDAVLEGHNTFHLMYWQQKGITPEPVRKKELYKGR